MAFVKKEEEEEEACYPQPCCINDEKHAGVIKVKEEVQDENEVEEKYQPQSFQDAIKEEQSLSSSQTEDTSSQSSAQITRRPQCGNTLAHTRNPTKQVTSDKPSENHSRTGQFTCNQCGKTYVYKSKYDQHMQIHTNNIFSCSLCEKSFIYKTQLDIHMRVHTKEEPYTCHQCDETFRWSNSLKYHLLRHHSEVLQYKCDQCPKTFAKASYLKTHLNTHAEEKYCDCAACKKRFLQSGKAGAVNATGVSHKKKNTFTCSKCGQVFTCKRRLDKHMVSHDKGTCAQCGRMFATLQTLKMHMRVHTGEKPFTCSQCGKKFSHDGTFRRHKLNCHQDAQAVLPEKKIPKSKR